MFVEQLEHCDLCGLIDYTVKNQYSACEICQADIPDEETGKPIDVLVVSIHKDSLAEICDVNKLIENISQIAITDEISKEIPKAGWLTFYIMLHESESQRERKSESETSFK